MTDYGRDTLCIDTLSTGRLARGPRLVGQRCYHRLITPRGTLLGGRDEADFGLDLASLVGSTSPPSSESLAAQIRAELLKDPEVESVTAHVEESRDGALIRWTITVDARSAKGPFRLVVGVSDVSVELLGLA